MKVIKSFFHTKRQQRVAYLLMIITAIIWGGTWPIGRWLVSEEVGGATIPPFMIAFIRYILAVISFFIILKVKEGGLNWKYAKRNWKLLSIMGVLSVTIYQAGYLIGEIFTAASDASIMVATNAIWVVVLSSIFLKSEHFTWRKLFGTLLAFIAVVIVVGFSPNINLVNRILGDLLILLAALAYASYSVISRFFMVKTQQNSECFQPSSIWIISWVSFYGLLTTTPIALIISPDYLNPVQYIFIPVRVWVGIAYLAFISSIIAYTFYLEGIKRLDASRAAIFQTLVPIFGVLFSAIFLQEDFDIIIYPFALLLVISGITLVNLKTSLNNANKGSNVFELIDFEKINENEALIRLKSVFNFFIAAMLKMKNVDNFNHTP
ncbi:MAG: DMT family transporter, partial [Candidatus Thorarchaeota archaeon]